MFNFAPFIIILCVALFLIKPMRKSLIYCAKNIAAVIFFISVSLILSMFGLTVSVNIFSVASALFLGLPGISLALFLSLII